ncbi:MAG: amidohydrolase [Candidatus Marinimicrobia bacterium]|nr:amidohydrolase [Candidatus Neomarinimicrobiota bacterium]MCF7829833.1 amidohydrolase [Candidatus Neomarinimicrobiota bacterium]MCF7881734.1 amidohydrolase [Candidatus Neomarinimicrobiota bacterium]MCF8232841.1 amidohydrolase [Bacteroidales bacterium]
MLKIDAHMHVNFNGFTVEDIIQYLDTNGIDRCWLMSWEELNPVIPKYYKDLPIENVMEAYEKYPERIIPLYAPDPRRNDLSDQIEIYIERGIRGYGEVKVPLRWDSTEIESLLLLLQKHKLPILFHMQGMKSYYIPKSNNPLEYVLDELMNEGLNGIPRKFLFMLMNKVTFLKRRLSENLVQFPGYMLDFESLEQQLTKFPTIDFIGHGPYFWRNIAHSFDMDLNFDRGHIKKKGRIWRLMESYDNLHADISGKSGYNALTRDTKFAKLFMEKFYKKILFGTDNFFIGLEEYIMNLGLPSYKLKRIFASNAEELISFKN